MIILQRQPPPGAQGRKVWQAGKPVWQNETKLKGLVQYLKGTNMTLFLHAKNIGAWLSIRGTMIWGTVLYTTEFRDFLCTRYNVSILNLRSHWDGCGTAFGVIHAIICITVSLVIVCHKKICDKIPYLSRQAFTPASIHVEPLIHQGCTKSEKNIYQGSDKDKTMWGDVMILGLWGRQVKAIIYVKLGHTDTDYYKYEPISALLYWWETIKKDKHGKHCNYQQKKFCHFFSSWWNYSEGSPDITCVMVIRFVSA